MSLHLTQIDAGHVPRRSSPTVRHLTVPGAPTSHCLKGGPRGAATGREIYIVTDHATLIRACALGETDALKTLMQAEGGRMLGVARRMLRRTDLAEDAVQDALVLVWRRAHQFDASRGSAKGWLYTILRNRCLTMLRQEEREIATEAEQLDTTPDASILAAAFDGLEETTGLRQCLDRLDAATRDAILSSYILGHSHGEIAGRMETPLGTIKARVRRGLLKLRECLS